MSNTLQDIEAFLREYTAIRFAEFMVNEKSKDREELYVCWGADHEEPIEKVQERLFLSCLDRYAEHIKVLKGFINSGKVFALNKADKIMFFVAENNDGYARLVTHYNPLGIDCLEERVRVGHLMNEFDKNVWDFSLKEEELISELNNIFKTTNP